MSILQRTVIRSSMEASSMSAAQHAQSAPVRSQQRLTDTGTRQAYIGAPCWLAFYRNISHDAESWKKRRCPLRDPIYSPASSMIRCCSTLVVAVVATRTELHPTADDVVCFVLRDHRNNPPTNYPQNRPGRAPHKIFLL